MTYTRDDVQTHSDGFGPGRPAVNVKVYKSMWDRATWGQFNREEREDEDEDFTPEWVEANVNEETLDRIFWHCCEFEFEYLDGWATGSQGDSLFPDDRVTLWQEGRSGGWVVVDGLPDIEEWDAIRLARWRKFERIARDIADGIPYQVISAIYINHYQWAKEEAEEAARAARQDIATVMT